MKEIGFVIKDIKTGKYWKSITRRWTNNILEAKVYQTEKQALNILNDCGYFMDKHTYSYFLEAYPDSKIFKIEADIQEKEVQ